MFPNEEETRLWVAINLSQRFLYRTMDTALKAEGLPPLRWYDVLWVIERTDGKGLRPYEIENSGLFEQSNLSRMLQRIVQEGYIEELTCPKDGRGKIIQITDKGKEVRLKMWKVYGPMIKDYINRLSADEKPELIADSLLSIIDWESPV